MTSQDETIAFLSNGANCGLPGAEVERIETHGSVIFLVGDRAYKLKRPVAFSALDYTTVQQREAACRAELWLNRRTAPELYLGVHAICRKPNGELAFDGDGTVMDWVVAMRRFDQADLFDHLADAGCLTPNVIAVLADEIARFHEAAERTPGHGGADGLRAAIELNRCDQQTVEAVIGHDAVATLHKASLEVLERVAPLLDRRRGEGRVRRCHGDLRLANICLLDGRPTLFDAIEFDDQVSCIDVLFDVAFLLTDLHHRGLEILANILFNQYLDTTGDTDGLAALPLMLSVRAATRAYALAGAAQRSARPDDARPRAAGALSYLALAESLLADAPGRLIAIGGVAGSIKTSVAYELAASFQPAPGARVLRSEVARRKLLDLSPGARLQATAYDGKTTERVYAHLAAEAAQTVRAGFTAIVDADFVRAGERQTIIAAATEASVPFVGLWLGSARNLQADGAAGTDGWHAVARGAEPATIPANRHHAISRMKALTRGMIAVRQTDP
ncbi:MAG TPA: AAA family ATPase [Stellaceae bacterium]|nr:AAA family ATPase [Stellaceae bacterium]